MRKQRFIASLFVLMLLTVASFAHAETSEEKKQDLIRQMDEVIKITFELSINGTTDEKVYFTLSTGEEWIATRIFENGHYSYSAMPVKPAEPEEELKVQAFNEYSLPPANPADVDSIPKEELNAAIAKANELWQARANDEAEVFRTSYSEKDWKIITLKTESGPAYTLLRQGIDGEIIRGPHAVSEDEPVIQPVSITQGTEKEPETALFQRQSPFSRDFLVS